MTPDPTPAPGPSPDRGSAPRPAGFRGIGGHLIRPPAPPAEAAAAPPSHGSHLLAPVLDADGSRAALCPVCRAQTALPAAGGWLAVRCESCGTEFVATDGSPPPAPSEPAPAPARSPIAPAEPLDPLELGSDRPRSFTSDVRTDAAGHRRVTCPQCLGAEVLIPRGATVAVVLRCPACHGPFLVGLGADTSPPPPPPPPSAPAPIIDADGRLWDYCPNCGLAALSPGRAGPAFVLTCGVCGQQIVVSVPPSGPAPSLWRQIRRWFFGG